MINKNKHNKTKNNYLAITLFAPLIALIVLFITLGYSSFQSTGMVKDVTATVRPETFIRVTSLDVDTTSNATVLSKDYTSVGHNNEYITSVFSQVTFTRTTSSVKYAIEVANFGNVEMGLASITGLPNNLDYELDTNVYNLGEKICNSNNECTLGAKKTIYVTIKYKSGSGTNTSTTLNANFNLTFKELHNIYYNSTAIDYVIDGGNKTVSLGNNPPAYIRVSGTLTDSSYTSPNVTLTAVTSDIYIIETHKIYIANVEYSQKVDDGGNITVNLGNNAPTNATDITISGTYGTSSYNNPNLTINGVTTDIYITISSGGGGNGGTWDDPVEDNTVTVYDPDNMTIPANSTIIYEGVTGEPQISTDANGDITHFQYMNIDQSTGISSPSGGLDTGILAFDGTDFEVTLKGKFNYDTKSLNPVIVMSSKIGGSTQGVVLFNSKNKQKYTKLDGSTNVNAKTDINRFRTIRYNNGTIADYYNLTKLNQTSENYTIGYVSSDAPVTVTLKMYCQSNKVSAELYNSSGTKVGVLPNNFKYDFTGVDLSGITIELGHWVNNSDTVYDYTFTILEFEVKKIN